MAEVTTAGGKQAAQALAAAHPGNDADDEALVEGDLLVEEISIDGMCGVY